MERKILKPVFLYFFALMTMSHLGLTQTLDENPDALLLKNYRPTSIYKVADTQVEKAKFPVIDLHAHPYADSEEELDKWVRTMDEMNIDKSVILTYQTGKAFDSLYQFYQKYPDRFILFCGFDYSAYNEPDFAEKAVKELERCYQAGARGVGELGDKGKGLFYSKPSRAFGMHIDDERMKPLLKKCGELGMPISIHVAEPIWMYQPMDSTNDGLMNAFKWRLDNEEGIKGHAEMVKTLENAVRNHPSTTFIACHYINSTYDLEILGNLFDRYPNLYADIAARYAEAAAIPRHAYRFFSRYADRLVYGTDMGMDKAMYQTTFRILESSDDHFYDHSLFSYHWPLYGFGLESTTLEKVYSANAMKILKLE